MKKLVIISFTVFLLLGMYGNLYSANEESEAKKAIVTVKYIDVENAYVILNKFISRKGKIFFVGRENKLIIEDTPEVVEKILSILKEIDVKPVNMQFNFELILGTTTSEADLDETLKSDPIIKELQNLLKYNTFKRVDSTIIKIQNNQISRQRIGREEVNLRLQIRPRYIKEEKVDTFQVDLELRQQQGINREGKEITTVLIETMLTIKSGERTVVGVSKLDGGNKALILIVSGKVIA